MRISDWSSDVCSSDLADIEDLLDQAVHDVFVGTPGPEQTGQRDVDDDQGGGEEGDLATEQPEPAVDVAVEGVEEAVDDADVVHVSGPARMRKRRPRDRKSTRLNSSNYCASRMPSSA